MISNSVFPEPEKVLVYAEHACHFADTVVLGA